MKRRIPVIVLSFCILSVLSCATKPDAVRWGEPVNGLQAGLSVKSAVSEPKPTVTLKFHIRNVGDRPIRIWKLSSQSSFWWRCLPLEVRTDGKLHQYKGPVLTPPPPPFISAFPYLGPGQSDIVKVDMYPEYWGLNAPFEAEVIFVFENKHERETTVGPYDEKEKKWSSVDGLWTGTARSGAVRIKVGL